MDSYKGRILVFNSFFGVGAPFIGSGDPKAAGKGAGLVIGAGKGAARV